MATEFKRVTMADVPTTALPNTTNANSDLYRPAATVDTVVIGMLLTNKSGASVVAESFALASTACKWVVMPTVNYCQKC